MKQSMKRSGGVLLAALLCALLLMGSATALTIQPVQTAFTLYINTGPDAPVYGQANGEQKLARVLAAGEAVELLGQDGARAEILLFDAAGQRMSGFVEAGILRAKTAQDTPSFALVNSPDPAIRLQLHNGASRNAKSLGKYYNGVLVRVLQAPKDAWVKVGIGSLEGFMELQYLAMDQSPGSITSHIPVVTVRNPGDPGLTLRAGQSYQSDKLGGYSNGAIVRVLGVTEEFAQVLTEDGRIGFMMASGLAPQPVYADIDTQIQLPQPEGWRSVIDNPGGQGAHLRTKGSTASDSLGLYPNGTLVVVTGGSEWWRKVWVDGREGYMMGKLIRGFEPNENTEEDGWTDSWEP